MRYINIDIINTYKILLIKWGKLAVELKPGKTNLFCIYMGLVSSFSRIEGFNGWMIAKAEFKIEKATCINNKISIDETLIINETAISTKLLKQCKNYSVISACIIYKNLEYTVVMYIVKPYSIGNNPRDIADKADNLEENNFIKQVPAMPFNKQGTYLTRLKYTTEDIKRFTEFTGDKNLLHQTVMPVVPGFLMFGDIIKKELYKYIAGNTQVKFIIYFRNPAFADEVLDVYIEAGAGKIIAVQADGYKGNGYKDIRKKPCYKWEADIIT